MPSSIYRRLDRRIKNINRAVETKYIDFAVERAPLIGGLTVAAASGALVLGSTFNNFTVIGAGTSPIQRVGRQIHVTSVKIILTFYATDQVALPNDLFNNIRILLVKVKNTSSLVSFYDLAEVLFQPNNAAVALNSSILVVNANYNRDKHTDFKVLFDKIFNISGPAFNLDSTPDAGYDASGKVNLNMTIKVPLGFDVQYTEGSSNPNANAVCLYLFSDSTTTPHPFVSYNARLYFTDL